VFGVCGPCEGGTGDAGTSGGGSSSGVGASSGGSSSGGTGPSCALYGQLCSTSAQCCNGVPCSGGRCEVPLQ
jgi:hypothetical protein